MKHSRLFKKQIKKAYSLKLKIKFFIFCFLVFYFQLSTFNCYAQAPQAFQYQAVVRDASGTAMVSQPVNFQISIISGSIIGTVEYVETHAASTNAFGVVTLNIGTGTPSLGTFNGVIWGISSHYIKLEADPAGGTSYLDMGTTQLLSVPYSLYSEKAGNIPTYTSGAGIDVTGTIISNTSPDQNVTLTQGGATTITGTYPNFTISSTDNNTSYSAGTGINVTGTTITNTAPDQTVSLTQGGATTVSGTYPNFTISSTDNNTTYSAGTGLNLTGTTFSNTAPDQTVTMTNGTGITISGSYPSYTITNSNPNAVHTGDVTGASALTIANNAVTTAKIADGNVTAIKLNSMSATNGQVLKFNGANWAPATDANTTYTAGTGINVTGTTITNTAPDQTVSLTQGGATTVSGTYPNFTINSTDLNTGTPGGLNKTVQFNNAGSFDGDTAMIWDNTNKRLGVGITNPNGRMVIRGSATALATEPLFEVKNAAGQTVFVVYPDSVHIYVKDGGAKSNRGGFAVSGRNNSKAFTNNFLTVTPDSTRIFTGDPTLGFGVENIGSGTSTSYMNITPENYFIGHESGINTTTGLYNSFFGYQAGKFNTVAMNNVFMGYKSGMNNISGNNNVGIGHSVLNNNTTGAMNAGIGYQSLFSNTTGSYNCGIGYLSLFYNIDGHSNVAIGDYSMYNNTSGEWNTASGLGSMGGNTTGNANVALGGLSLNQNTTGSFNTAVGYNALYANTTSLYNSAFGFRALVSNTTGTYNVAAGSDALYSCLTGSYNVSMGPSSLANLIIGSNNTAIGNFAYLSGDYNNSTAIGSNSVITANNQVRIGDNVITSIGGFADWTNVSDKRLKKDIKKNVPGLDFIMKLEPVTYYLDMNSIAKNMHIPDSLRQKESEAIKGSLLQTGFIAQDVEKAANEIGFDFSGIDKPKNENDFYGLRYAEFTVPLVKAVQELDAKNKELLYIIEKQQALNNDLIRRIEMLEKK